LLRGLRGTLANRATAAGPVLEDAVQKSLVRILQRLPQFQGRSHFLTWATAIAIHSAMSELWRRRKDIALDEVMANTGFRPERAVDRDPGPSEQLQRGAMVATLHRLIRTDLTEKQQAALLAELGGMPQDQITRRLGSNRNAVYKLTHDARKRLNGARRPSDRQPRPV
jgi:RNA polymerase sigma-70 factor (ECF subfamily)